MKGRFTILGTSSAIPTKERNHPAIYFQYKDTAFLFDCGEGTQRQIQKAGVSFYKIDKIFITHLHGDHVLGLPGLLQTLDFHDKDYVEIYGTKGIAKLIELATTQCFYLDAEGLVVKVKEIETSTEPLPVVDEKEYTVKAVGMEHTVPCLGYAFEEKPKFGYNREKVRKLGLKAHHFKELEEKGYTILESGRKVLKGELGEYKRGFKFVYITDTYYTENIFKLTEGADYVVMECTYLNEDETAKEVKHLSFNIFRRRIYPVFQEQGVKNVILTHFSRRYKDLKPFEEAIKENGMENVFLAEDLMSFKF